ncbi:phage tail protein [Pontimicrobium sp. IMCC45349]|uniref:phage tail protein n=1 Tax=Pontimicrobium sp. IMCC45349 TaxID=3391574 RepID=UPI0039A013EB
MEDYIGTITAFGFGFTPRGWMPCNGQLLAISQNETLFSLLGTTYGGDGRTTFALPDLRGTVPISQGQSPGHTNRRIGEKGGSETNTLSVSQMAPHSHVTDFNGQNVNAVVSIPSLNDDGSSDESEGTVLANHTGAYAPASSADTSLAAFNAGVSGTAQSTPTGSGTPINNMQPFLTLNYCICTVGIYPPRN